MPQEMDRRQALLHECPRCSAKVGEQCVDMRMIRLGRIPNAGFPHVERVLLAKSRRRALPLVYR